MDLNQVFHHEAIAIVARTIYGEASHEPREGKIAVACVIQNRVRSDSWYGNDPAECCLWPYQFSCWNDEDPNRKRICNAEDGLRLPGGAVNGAFRECLEIAEQLLSGDIVDITQGSTHYYAPRKGVRKPAWANRNKPVVEIGNHRFFNNVK